LAWMLIVVTAGGDGEAGAGAVGPLELPEPPQLHDASATTIAATRLDVRMLISLLPTATTSTEARLVPGGQRPGFCGREPITARTAYCGRKEFTRFETRPSGFTPW